MGKEQILIYENFAFARCVLKNLVSDKGVIMVRNDLFKFLVLFLFVFVISLVSMVGCGDDGGGGGDQGDFNGEPGIPETKLEIFNEGEATTVFATFSTDSCTVISDWSTIPCTSGDTKCTTTVNPNICSFPIASGDTCTPPLRAGCKSSINFAFNPEVVTMPCGKTPGTGPSLAEVTINGGDCSKKPGCDSPPCDCADISLVNGYTLPNIRMTLSKDLTILGPTAGATGNQTVFGVFPVGCTNCLNRDGCPCGINCSDTSQCHQGGTPPDPDIPCLASQPTGGTITIDILAN